MPRPLGARCKGLGGNERQNLAFEDLLLLLRGEHARLEFFADSVVAENRRLRASGCAGEAGCNSEALPLEDPQTWSAWRQRLDERLDGEGCRLLLGGSAQEKGVAAPYTMQMGAMQVGPMQVAVTPPVAEGSNKDEDENDEEFDVAEVASNDDRRIDVCLTKLREFLELSGSKQTVSCDRIEDYLKRIGRPTDTILVAFGGVFDRLMERERTLGIAPPMPALKTSESMTTAAPKNSHPNPKKMGTSNLRGASAPQQVQLKTLAELLLAEDVEDLLGPCSDETLDCVRLLRMCTFHQDTMGILPSLRAVNDLEHECKQAALESRINLIMNMVIAANAICVGIFASTDGVKNVWGGAQISNMIFTLIFLFEALFKMYLHGLRRYFCSHDWAWNVFDLAVVGLGIGDFFITLALYNSGTFNTSSLMLVKLLRLGRLLRVFRMSVFRELKLMINGILGLCKTLSCAMMILLFSVYLISTILVQFLAGREDNIVHGQEQLFSSIPQSMFTVFRCLNLGDCAAANGTPIALQMSEAIGWPFTIAHCVLSVIMHYGLGSLMTALVVETTLNEAKKAEFQATLKETYKKQVSWSLHRLEQIFEKAQQGEDRKLLPQLPSMLFVGRKTFEEVVQLEEVQRIFDLLDIDAADRVALFDCLDSDGNGYVEIDEVVAGLLSMAGKARRADIVATRLKIDSFVKKFAATHAELLEGQAAIMERFDMFGSPGGQKPAPGRTASSETRKDTIGSRLTA